MEKKIKIIDLLCLASVKEEMPKKIRGRLNRIYKYSNFHLDYQNESDGSLLFANLMQYRDKCLNEEVEILDEEDDEDIPLIPDNELFLMKQNGADIRGLDYLDYNFKILQEKINQVVEGFNKYRKEVKENE